MIDRKKKKRALEQSNIVHAAGWINESDKPAFDNMVADATLAVQRVVDRMGENKDG